MKVSNLLKSDAGPVTVTNVLGEDVTREAPSVPRGTGLQLDLSKLTPGIYFVRLQVNDQVTTKQIVKTAQ